MADFTDVVFDLNQEQLLLSAPDDALSGVDLQPPILTILPTGGDILPDAALTIEASDDRVLSIVTIFAGDRVIYDGDEFTADYSSSTRTLTPSGVSLLVRRNAGWDGRVVIDAVVVDAGGNLRRVDAVFDAHPAPGPLPEPPPPAEPRTLEQYKLMALSLLPRGTAFALHAASGVSDFLEGAMVEFARLDAAAHELLDAALPDRAQGQYLAAWEHVLGLPLDLGYPVDTLALRQLEAQRWLLRDGSNNRAAYEAVISAAGYTLEDVRYFSPFEVGRSAVGEALYGDGSMHTVELVVGGLVTVLPEVHYAEGSMSVSTYKDAAPFVDGDIVLIGPLQRAFRIYFVSSGEYSQHFYVDTNGIDGVDETWGFAAGEVTLTCARVPEAGHYTNPAMCHGIRHTVDTPSGDPAAAQDALARIIRAQLQRAHTHVIITPQ